ncbi:MAG TPA: DUF4382 domain-containing protein, partial [Chitinophagaceae bacterium]|nr:DUF4382 domain-containing protein [Chitinophagaceae bacterium]
MKQLRLPGIALGLLLLTIITIFSCQKERDSNNEIPDGQQRVRIRLSDNPVNFDAVNVDIQRVEVLVLPDSCRDRDDDDDDDGRGRNHCDYDNDGNNGNYGHCAVWDTLDIRAGVYNLLDLSNGVDTLLANGFTVQGKIKKIRLTI